MRVIPWSSIILEDSEWLMLCLCKLWHNCAFFPIRFRPRGFLEVIVLLMKLDSVSYFHCKEWFNSLRDVLLYTCPNNNSIPFASVTGRSIRGLVLQSTAAGTPFMRKRWNQRKIAATPSILVYKSLPVFAISPSYEIARPLVFEFLLYHSLLYWRRLEKGVTDDLILLLWHRDWM